MAFADGQYGIRFTYKFLKEVGGGSGEVPRKEQQHASKAARKLAGLTLILLSINA
jgi:hypothetical protein